MEKARVLIEKAIAGDREIFKSLYDIREASRIYNEVLQEGSAFTINGEVMSVFKNAGCIITDDTIGYRIANTDKVNPKDRIINRLNLLLEQIKEDISKGVYIKYYLYTNYMAGVPFDNYKIIGSKIEYYYNNESVLEMNLDLIKNDKLIKIVNNSMVLKLEGWYDKEIY